MKKQIASLLLLSMFTLPAFAKLQVFACEPEWGSLLQELAADKIDVSVGTTALQDVHQIDAKPSLIAKVRKADLLVCTGADLEVGWLPQLIQQSGNPESRRHGQRLFHGREPGHDAGEAHGAGPAAGDVHPQGNPHFQMDPYRVLKIATALGARLAAAGCRQCGDLPAARSPISRTRWQAATKALGSEGRAAQGQEGRRASRGRGCIWNKWLGLEQVGALEPKPGVPPTSAHLCGLIDTTKSEGTRTPSSAPRTRTRSPAQWLAERTGVPAVVLPFTVGGDAQSKDLFGLFDSTIDKLLGAAK